MRDNNPPTTTYTGHLLVAHPGLKDPNFRKTVVLLSAHDPDEGALGVIVNRPTGKSLGDLRNDLSLGPLGEIPVFQGGPVAENELLLAAWKWDMESQNFRLYFGLDPDRLEGLLLEDPELEGRAFLGYSGWGEGQLEKELTGSDWILGAYSAELKTLDEESLWRQAIHHFKPELGFLTDAPDDPSVN